MRFSARTAWNLEENALTTLLRERRAREEPVLDLTISSPAACGLSMDAETVLSHLRSDAALRYEPDPLGAQSARAAVCAYYRGHGAELPTRRVCLTSSTSEGYSFLFRLLCNVEDEVLVARPSYPLFDFLAQLDDVCLVEYPLVYEHGWHIDLAALERAVTPRTRAVLVVNPNNPTGNAASAAERKALLAICAKYGLALIVDEVFLDYALGSDAAASFAAEQPEVLTFVLSGLSKVCGLPQMKVSWIAVRGPRDMVQEAMATLEVIADTFLSVNSPAQNALPAWLDARISFQQSVTRRLLQNIELIDENLKGSLATRLQMNGGWTAMLRVPRTVDGLPFAEAALQRGVLVQAGEFYGSSAGHIVLSLLTPPDILRKGLDALPIR